MYVSLIFTYVFAGCASPCSDTFPLVPCMAGGLAEWLRHFNDLAVGETEAPACFGGEESAGSRILSPDHFGFETLFL